MHFYWFIFYWFIFLFLFIFIDTSLQSMAEAECSAEYRRLSDDKYGSIFQRFPNPNPNPTNPTNTKVGNLRNNEPSEYQTFGISSSYYDNIRAHIR